MSEIEILFHAVTALIASQRTEYHNALKCHDVERRRTHHQTLALLVPPHRSLAKLLQQERVASQACANLSNSRFATAGLGLVRTLLECVVWKNGRTLSLSPAIQALPVTSALVSELRTQMSSSGAAPWVPEGSTLGELASSFDAYCCEARRTARARAAAHRLQVTKLLKRLEKELDANDWTLLKSVIKMP